MFMMCSPMYSDREKLNHLVAGGDAEEVVNHIKETQMTPSRYTVDDKSQHSPVYVAARWGHVDVLQVLISVGFDFTTAEVNVEQPFASHCPIHIASFYGHVSVVKALVEDYSVHVDVEFGEVQVPLWYAILGGRYNVVQYLLEHRAAVNNDNYSLLIQAILLGHADICESLISRGAEVTDVDACGRTPLFLAVLRGNIDIVSVLVEAGVDINEKNASGSTVFFMATEAGNLKMLQFLHSRGADASFVNKEGKTSLHMAIKRKNMDIVRYLFVNLNMTQVTGSYMHLAVGEGAYDIVVLLIKAGCVFMHGHYQKLEELFDTAPTHNSQELMCFLRDSLSVPRSLEELSYLKVRALLGRNITDADCLPVPRRILSRIKLEHV